MALALAPAAVDASFSSACYCSAEPSTPPPLEPASREARNETHTAKGSLPSELSLHHIQHSKMAEAAWGVHVDAVLAEAALKPLQAGQKDFLGGVREFLLALKPLKEVKVPANAPEWLPDGVNVAFAAPESIEVVGGVALSTAV